MKDALDETLILSDRSYDIPLAHSMESTDGSWLLFQNHTGPCWRGHCRHRRSVQSFRSDCAVRHAMVLRTCLHQ